MTDPRTTSTNPTAQRRCAACDHRWNAHDDIAARYCAATITNGAKRGCVCDASD